MVVSGYHYLIWTDEEWGHVPSPLYNGVGNQQYLNGLSEEEGILAEIKRLAQYAADRRMRDWDYQTPRFIELKYEQTFGNEKLAFRQLFQHYGFTADAFQVCLKLAERFSFQNQTRNQPQRQKSHLRSGRSGQWRGEFDDVRRDYFKELLGDLLIQAGYEPNNHW